MILVAALCCTKGFLVSAIECHFPAVEAWLAPAGFGPFHERLLVYLQTVYGFNWYHLKSELLLVSAVPMQALAPLLAVPGSNPSLVPPHIESLGALLPRLVHWQGLQNPTVLCRS